MRITTRRCDKKDYCFSVIKFYFDKINVLFFCYFENISPKIDFLEEKASNICFIVFQHHIFVPRLEDSKVF